MHSHPRAKAIAAALSLVPALAAAQDLEGLRLKLDRQLRPAPPTLDRNAVRFLEADRIEGERDRTIVASGNVSLRQRGASIRADRVEYQEPIQTAVATGNVRLEREGDAATGPRLTYRLDNDTGEMETPVFEIPKKGDRKIAGRGSALRAVLEGENRSRLYNAEYTTCPVPRDDWFLRVRELEIDTKTNMGTAYNSTVHFLGVPILYAPWLSFPLDSARKTGFLAPTFGTSGQSGFEVALPYYWNIAENQDATFTPKLFSKRGLQLGAEYRYLMPTWSGQMDLEYLPSDRIANRDRWFTAWRHVHALPLGITGAINAQQVSDDDYFRDLSTRVAATSQTNLPRDVMLAWGSEDFAITGRAVSYQTLQDPAAPIVPPYRILPQILASGLRQNWMGGDWAFTGEISNFRHERLVNGQRFLANPSVQFPFRNSWGYVTPKAGWHFTRYNVDEPGPGVEGGTRSLPITSLDAGMYFDRPLDFAGNRFLQTLEPRLYYLHVPYRDQSRLPNFTTAETDFNFAQIFTENRFVGGDRIGDANQATIALTTRLVETATGLERVKAALGQVFYFEPQRVSLFGPPQEQQRSDVLGVVSSQVTEDLAVDAGFQYSPSRKDAGRGALAVRWHPEPGRVLNGAYRYTKDQINQVDFSAQWPLTRNLSGVARWNYSVRDRKLLEGLAGFEYNADCWQVRAVAHRFITATQQVTTSFQIQLELTGLSRIGINPLETLRQNIPGYRRTEEITR